MLRCWLGTTVFSASSMADCVWHGVNGDVWWCPCLHPKGCSIRQASRAGAHECGWVQVLRIYTTKCELDWQGTDGCVCGSLLAASGLALDRSRECGSSAVGGVVAHGSVVFAALWKHWQPDMTVCRTVELVGGGSQGGLVHVRCGQCVCCPPPHARPRRQGAPGGLLAVV